jgi:hypothetical protein
VESLRLARRSRMVSSFTPRTASLLCCEAGPRSPRGERQSARAGRGGRIRPSRIATYRNQQPVYEIESGGTPQTQALVLNEKRTETGVATLDQQAPVPSAGGHPA